MKIAIIMDAAGNPMVTVSGGDAPETPKDVAKAYKDTIKELEKKEEQT